MGSGYGPASLQSAYKLSSSTAGTGQTVAVVDAFDDPNAAANLATYRADWGLPACGTGCFKKVGETGTATLPRAIADLGAGVNAAVKLGAKFVSNSYGQSETASDITDDNSFFKHAGVAVTASAGDSGFKVSYPAASQYVVAVGGTALNTSINARGWTESVWNTSRTEGTSSGCSARDAKPAGRPTPAAPAGPTTT